MAEVPGSRPPHETRDRFLAEASSVLASSLDYETTVQRVAELAVPVLGDWCGVDLVDEHGMLRQLAVAHADPAKLEWAREFRRRYPPRPDSPTGSVNVVRTGKSEFYPEVTGAMLASASRDAEHLHAIRELDIHGVVIAPLSVSGRTIGAFTLVSSSSKRRYTQADVAIAEELGRRAALAIDNARLYRAEREARQAAENSAYRASLLHEVMTKLAQAVTPAEVASVALGHGNSALDAAHGVLYRLTADGSSLELLKAVGLHTETVEEFRLLRMDASLPLPDAIRSGTTVYLETRDEVLSRYPVLREASERGSTMPAWVFAPLAVGGSPVGGIGFGFASERKFGRMDREFIASLVQQVAQALDRSRLYELEREARHSAQSANRAKSEFLATMSHELRTPINAIQGYAQLLDLGIPGPVTDQQRQYLGRLTSSAQHLLGLVNEVLDLAKIESGTIRVDVESAVAGGTVDAALSLVKPQAMSKGIALSEQCEGAKAVPYMGDEHRVRQIIANLLSNAVKFTKPGGSVNVECSLTDQPPGKLNLKAGSPYVVFTVKDTGCGIAPHEVERIFEPFTQAETGGKTAYTRGASGTGLGLTISRRLARLMGGELVVESTPGVGSEFRLLLPAPERRMHPREPRTGSIGDANARHSSGDAPSQVRSLQPTAGPPARRVGRIGEALVATVAPLVSTWLEKLRHAPGFPDDQAVRRADLEDHFATMISDLGLALRFLDAGYAEPSELLRDGTVIMRAIAEQHGGQRFRIGWS
ncbi:MAG: ATP-binding protein, partial [Gemmatimonadota bacterium]|nr:ATP-binding protein [Gemmatimonadota bacterium]